MMGYQFWRMLLVLLTVFLGRVRSQKNGFFWQLTDMHVDTAYSPKHGDPENACHAVINASSSFNLSDFGDFRCDAPMDLIRRTILGMKDIWGEPDFILWNGDSSTHIGASGLPPPMSYVMSVERKIVSTLLTHFPHTKILPVLGNHDSSPPDFFPDSKVDTNTSFYRDYFLHSNWSDLIRNPSEREEFYKCGYYRSSSHGKTFLILNTNLYYQNDNKGVDPCDQLKWLMIQLSGAENNSVILAAHVPPGYYERTAYGPFLMTKGGDYHYNEFYVDLVNKYADKIYAQFYGHTHTDSFRLFGYPHNVTSVAFIAPSVTPKVDWVSGTFPSIRLYEYSSEKLLNYKQYYFNISKTEPAWDEAYDFGQNYGVRDLTPKSLQTVFENIARDPKVFDRYYELNTVFHTELPCDDECKQNHLCGLSQLRVQGMKTCLAQGPVAFASPSKDLSDCGVPPDISLFRLRLNPFAEFGVYVVIIAPLCGFLLSFAYLIRSRRLRVGRGYRTVPLSEEI